MKLTIITAVLFLWAGSLSSQNSIDDVLRSVEANNKDLRANAQLIQSQKLESRLDNNLPDPTVTYSHLYGNKEGMGFTGEFIASQSFDFPSLYAQKHKLTKAKSAGLDQQASAFRQQILLQAKEICLDLVLLNKCLILLVITVNKSNCKFFLYVFVFCNFIKCRCKSLAVSAPINVKPNYNGFVFL